MQGEAFDPVLAGRDVIGRSRTGTGKTLAFGLPAIARLNNQWFDENGYRDERGQLARGRPVSMVVLCPTRELARQVQDELAGVARPLGLYVDVFHGGVSYDPQVCDFFTFDSACFLDQLNKHVFPPSKGPCPTPGTGRSCRDTWTYH